MFLMTSWSDCNLQVIYTSFYLIADYKITNDEIYDEGGEKRGVKRKKAPAVPS